MKRRSMFYTDRQGRVRYTGSHGVKKSTSDIPIVAPRREKELQFITNQEGNVIPIGGPSSGGGSGTDSVTPSDEDYAYAEEVADALGEYFGDYSNHINARARGELTDEAISDYDLSRFDVDSKREYKDKIDSMVSAIDGAIETSVLTEPLKVYHGVSYETLNSFENTPRVGDVFSVAGFVSTSEKENIAGNHAYRNPRGIKVLAQIQLQPGDRALRATGMLEEYEWLMPRNTRFRLIKQDYYSYDKTFEWVLEPIR